MKKSLPQSIPDTYINLGEYSEVQAELKRQAAALNLNTFMFYNWVTSYDVSSNAINKILNILLRTFHHDDGILSSARLERYHLFGQIKGFTLPHLIGLMFNISASRENPTTVYVSIYCNDTDKETVLKEIGEKLLPVIPFYTSIKKDDIKRTVNFWSLGRNGASHISRAIDVFKLENILLNYDEKTKELLKELEHFKPNTGGQILLFSGPPGTGKTHVLRSLLWAWRHWAEANYIIDSSRFLGGDAKYLMDVICSEPHLENQDELLQAIFDDGDPNNPHNPKPLPKPRDIWKVIILEDAGEILRADAKSFIGQGLSQLLNASDGILGQGLRLLFIITTNEEIEALHPAISRPGRCRFRHEFRKLSLKESKDWVKLKGIELTGEEQKDYSLAELYAMLDKKPVLGDEPEKPKRKVGFV